MHYQETDEKRELKEENLKKIKNKIVVMSGKGGVGKSTVSVNLAYGLAAQGKRVGIMDVDFHGPSIAKMTNIEGAQVGITPDGKPVPIEAQENIFVLSVASLLPKKDDAIVWRGPMKIGVIGQFFGEFVWPDLDYLIVDCPPGTGDEPLSIIQTMGEETKAIIVSTPQDVAFSDARRSITFCEKLKVPIIGLVENMSGFLCPHCGKESHIFKQGGASKTAEDFNIEILGHIPIEAEIVESGDAGTPYVDSHKEAVAGKIFKEIATKIDSHSKS